MSVTYEPMKQKHLPAVAALQQSWEAEGSVYGLLADSETDIAGQLSPYCWVALDEGAVVGFVLATAHEGNEACVFPKGACYVEVDALYICPAYRSQGLGRQLLALCEQRAQGDGVQYFRLMSASKDAEAIRRFYTGNGYKVWSTEFFKERS